jgi:signal transduction histidine kinase/HPt (histidine-containing phosphotransfer) domain-containing protein
LNEDDHSFPGVPKGFPMTHEPSYEELRNRVNELEREAFGFKQAEDALRISKEAVEAANRIQSEILANMTHEMRTPIHGVIGMLGLALDAPSSASQREYLLLAQTSAGLLLRLINDVFDFSKMEAGKMELEETEMNLHQVVESAMRPLDLKAKEKDIELGWRIEADCPADLQGDAGRLTQVLLNIVGNALKFTDKGKIEVAVALEEETDEQVTLHFSVEDTGIGIPEDRLDDVFMPFKQVDGSSTRRHGGVGLGLSISRKLVEMMKGRIWCESTLETGTVFHFTAGFRRSGEGQIGAVVSRTLRDGPEHSQRKNALSSPQPVSSRVFNTSAPLKHPGGELKAMQDNIDLFFQGYPARFQAFQEAISRGEEPMMERIAGELKNMAASIGADKLADEIFRFQLAVRKGAKGKYGPLASRMEQEFENFRAARSTLRCNNIQQVTEQEATS